jgi:hypothetical protein
MIRSSLVVCFSALQAALASDEAQSLYEATWAHHAIAFGNLDVAETCLDYADNAHIITVEHTTHTRLEYIGKSGCAAFFSSFFPTIAVDGKFGDQFYFTDHSAPSYNGNTMFITWNSTTPSFKYEWATDTFVMNETTGKFTHHHIFASGLAITPDLPLENDGRNSGDPAWMLKMFFACIGAIGLVSLIVVYVRKKGPAKWEKKKSKSEPKSMELASLVPTGNLGSPTNYKPPLLANSPK